MSIAPSNEVADDAIVEAKPPFLRRVRIRGYKSIAFCDVTLEPLTILVGRNATGKSNFVDALAFVRDALATNLTQATKLHGGWQSILSRFSPSGEISFELEMSLSSEAPSAQDTRLNASPTAVYGFVLKEGPVGSAVLIREWFQSQGTSSGNNSHYSLIGTYDPVATSVGYTWEIVHPQIVCKQVPYPRPDRLWIASLGKEPFMALSDRLRLSGYYNFNPEVMRLPQRQTAGSFLERDGSNLASVIESTRKVEDWAAERAARYLATITGSVEFAGVQRIAEFDTLRFRAHRDGPALEFDAASMSDGTLRAFAALMAAFQLVPTIGSPSLVAIEEPETALHPAAMRALVAAFDEATLRTQILLTTHSPDLLDAVEVKPANLRVVQLVDGQTVIGPVDEAGVEIVTRKLNSLAGLERENQLEPDLDDQDRQRELARTQEDGP